MRYKSEDDDLYHEILQTIEVKLGEVIEENPTLKGMIHSEYQQSVGGDSGHGDMGTGRQVLRSTSEGDDYGPPHALASVSLKNVIALSTTTSP